MSPRDERTRCWTGVLGDVLAAVGGGAVMLALHPALRAAGIGFGGDKGVVFVPLVFGLPLGIAAWRCTRRDFRTMRGLGVVAAAGACAVVVTGLAAGILLDHIGMSALIAVPFVGTAAFRAAEFALGARRR